MKKVNLFLTLTFFVVTPIVSQDESRSSELQAYWTGVLNLPENSALKELYAKKLNALKANYADKIADWHKQNVPEDEIEKGLEDGALQEAVREYDKKIVMSMPMTRLAPAKNSTSAGNADT